jgi:hypothetical protein
VLDHVGHLLRRQLKDLVDRQLLQQWGQEANLQLLQMQDQGVNLLTQLDP